VAEVFSFPVKNGRVLFGADTFQFYQAERSFRDGDENYRPVLINATPHIWGYGSAKNQDFIPKHAKQC
jgi:hypothetical protein